MWISTFHALCARLLRREAPNIGLSRDFVIYDSSDQQSVIKQLIKEYGFDDGAHQPRQVLGRISHAKNRMEGPETFEKSWNPKDKEIGAPLLGISAGRSRRRQRSTSTICCSRRSSSSIRRRQCANATRASFSS